MSLTAESAQNHRLDLPESAPRVRITAGAGSAGQKTWNLRRPVTLIGSRRPAHIVLHDKDISHAHCVVINTGREVLLKDFCTSSGTYCNDKRVDLVPLSDGDVVTVGSNRIQVAIHLPKNTADDSACGMSFADPTLFKKPVLVGLLHTDQQWELLDAVNLIGRHASSKILLDNEDVSRRHAVIFRFENGPVIFDLGGRGGIWVNGKQCTLSRIVDSDRITIGPFGLRVALDGADFAAAPKTPDDPTSDPNAQPPDNAGVLDKMPPLELGDAANQDEDSQGGNGNVDLEHVESHLENLQGKITDSWDHLNVWQSKLVAEAGALDQQESDLADREATQEARDAAIRGQLHDVTRFGDQLAERERALAAEAARVQEERDQLAADRKAFDGQDAENTQRLADLKRREHVLAQRWGRLKATICPHCGKALAANPTNQPQTDESTNTTESGTTDADHPQPIAE